MSVIAPMRLYTLTYRGGTYSAACGPGAQSADLDSQVLVWLAPVAGDPRRRISWTLGWLLNIQFDHCRRQHHHARVDFFLVVCGVTFSITRITTDTAHVRLQSTSWSCSMISSARRSAWRCLYMVIQKTGPASVNRLPATGAGAEHMNGGDSPSRPISWSHGALTPSHGPGGGGGGTAAGVPGIGIMSLPSPRRRPDPGHKRAQRQPERFPNDWRGLEWKPARAWLSHTLAS